MGKFTIYIVLIVVLVWDSTSAKNIAGDGYCEVDGQKIKQGESIPAPIGKCQETKCLAASKESLDWIIGHQLCSEWDLKDDSKCYKSDTDLTKLYPECCPIEVCPED